MGCFLPALIVGTPQFEEGCGRKVCKGRESFMGRTETGIVTLEFLLLFPLVVAMLYAAATYGIVFFTKYKMQGAVSNAVNAALYVDRSAYTSGVGSDEVGGAARGRAKSALDEAIGRLSLSGLGTDGGNCGTSTLANNVEMIQCTLTYTKVDSLVPIMSFGWLGQFPPLPKSLKVTASAAF